AARVETAGHGSIEDEPLSPAEVADEMLLMGLRLAEGVDLARLAGIGGVQPAAASIERLQRLGMLEWRGNGRLAATRAGRFVLNEIVRQLSASFAEAGQP
ncbi:MAG TPA: coproporphyrinogen III oxidase, partial [Hyphomicrobiaceae bacterium]|nr:coproporphyrinogen III oxidase [Hyphomicrobiaceae bacterium]